MARSGLCSTGRSITSSSYARGWKRAATFLVEIPDTETILHLYEEMGSACLQHLDGMFAFALWDGRKRRWLLARDKLGVKPLYYTHQQGLFAFASEIKALLAHPLISADLDEDAMGQYLTFKTSPAPRTMFSNIQKLPAGSVLISDEHGNMSIDAYWDPVSDWVVSANNLQEKEVVGTVRDLFSQAVAKRMMADVPVGAFLSGGLDSSAIVAQMASLGSVKTFSVGIRDLPQHSEFSFARQVAQRFRTDHHEVEIGVRDVEEYLPEMVHQQDEPLADPVCVPLFHVSKLAARMGVPVVLVGEGSDEQFFGYDTRVSFLRRYQHFWRPLLAVPRPLLSAAHRSARLFHRASGFGSRSERILQTACARKDLFFGSMAFGEGDKADLLVRADVNGIGARQVIARIKDELRLRWPTAGIAAEVMYLDLKIRLAELLLMRVDKITMSQSLEARGPFLDYRLIEYTMSLPLSLKLKGWTPKYIFKQAMRGIVPDAIVNRVKQPFAAPIEDWLRTGLGPFARHVILNSNLRSRRLFRYDAIERILSAHERGDANHGVQIWTLMNLSAWYDRWIVGSAG